MSFIYEVTSNLETDFSSFSESASYKGQVK